MALINFEKLFGITEERYKNIFMETEKIIIGSKDSEEFVEKLLKYANRFKDKERDAALFIVGCVFSSMLGQ